MYHEVMGSSLAISWQIEPIYEEARNLVHLEDMSQYEHTHESIEHTDEVIEDNPDQRVSPEELGLPNLLLD